MINSYPKVKALGHRELQNLFNDPVVVEEKVDGSQVSFGVIDGELHMRSKGRSFTLDSVDSLFRRFADVADGLFRAGKLVNGIVYRGEYLSKPKHNSLQYDRVPKNHVVLFDGEDLNKGQGYFLDHEELSDHAATFEMDVIPRYARITPDMLDRVEWRKFLDMKPLLGGKMIEGIVVKSHTVFGADGKHLVGKFVADEFKEIHNKEWKKSNPGRGDIIEEISLELSSPARFRKAVEWLRDQGRLQGAPQDIGPLVGRVRQDLADEATDFIKDELFKAFGNDVIRKTTNRVPLWYKAELAKEAGVGFGGGR